MRAQRAGRRAAAAVGVRVCRCCSRLIAGPVLSCRVAEPPPCMHNHLLTTTPITSPSNCSMNALGDDHVSFSAAHLAASPCGRLLLVSGDNGRLVLYETGGETNGRGGEQSSRPFTCHRLDISAAHHRAATGAAPLCSQQALPAPLTNRPILLRRRLGASALHHWAASGAVPPLLCRLAPLGALCVCRWVRLLAYVLMRQFAVPHAVATARRCCPACIRS